jgi:hypothetical protein
MVPAGKQLGHGTGSVEALFHHTEWNGQSRISIQTEPATMRTVSNPNWSYETEGAAGGRRVTERREGQVGGNQLITTGRQLFQQTYSNAGRSLGIVFEAVVPLGGLSNPGWKTASPAKVNRSPPDSNRRYPGEPACLPAVVWQDSPRPVDEQDADEQVQHGDVGNGQRRAADGLRMRHRHTAAPVVANRRVDSAAAGAIPVTGRNDTADRLGAVPAHPVRWVGRA